MRRWLILLLVAALSAGAGAERIKDIVEIQGVRSNPIWGYGLVVGLNGTGDDSDTSRRALANTLRRTGLVVDPKDVKSKSIASVIVTADLPPFGRSGSKLDVTVSAIGNATSLQGGTLLMTPLVGADGEVYAVCQGAISVGGFSAAGEAASVSKNHPTVGRIPSGATIEKEELATYVENGSILLQVRNPDFTTAERIAEAVNKAYPRSARPTDGGAVEVRVPEGILREGRARPRPAGRIGSGAGNAGDGNAATPVPVKSITAFIDRIGALEVTVDQPALVVINERTGTIVVGEAVTVSTVAITHGSLTIKTKEKENVSQPLPFAPRGAKTEKTSETEIQTDEEQRSLHVMPRQTTVAELARALNAMGLTPRDLIAIFQALRQAGALQAELKIM